MDCPNVCIIIHWSPSGDIEQYMQESGRARRDGLPTEAVLYNVPLKEVEVFISIKRNAKIQLFVFVRFSLHIS